MQKVAIPTDDGQRLAHFGRAKTMAIFTVDNGQVVSRENRPNPDPDHIDPAHHKIMFELVKGSNAVIATHMGPPMVATMNKAGIQVLVAPSESVDESLQAYLKSQQGGPALSVLSLEAAEAAHGPGHHHHHDHDHGHHHH